MKVASPALQALIFSGAFIDFDCYTIVLPSGTTLRYTSADFNISDGLGHTWDSTSVLIDDAGSKPQAHWKVGLDVDTWSTTFMPRAFDPITKATFPDTINGMPFLAAAVSGAFDGAQVTVTRAYFSTPPANPIPASGVQPVGFLTIFFGIVGEADVSSSRVTLSIADMRQLLTINMPRLVYQAPCPHILFDSRCTLSAASYVKTGTVLSGSTASNVLCSISAPYATVPMNNEQATIPATGPYTYTVDFVSTWVSDIGVTYSASGAPLTKVSGAPATGQYSVSGGVYTFAAADEGLGILVSYDFSATYTFTLGKITFTSGQNVGISRTVRLWDGASSLYLMTPAPFAPQSGDTFNVYPGCDKSMGSCTNFGNLLNYGGTPFVPVPEVTT